MTFLSADSLIAAGSFIHVWTHDVNYIWLQIYVSINQCGVIFLVACRVLCTSPCVYKLEERQTISRYIDIVQSFFFLSAVLIGSTISFVGQAVCCCTWILCGNWWRFSVLMWKLVDVKECRRSKSEEISLCQGSRDLSAPWRSLPVWLLLNPIHNWLIFLEKSPTASHIKFKGFFSFDFCMTPVNLHIT